MLSNLMDKLKGRKTYGSIILWVFYKIAVGQGWIGDMPNLEIALLGIAGLSLRESISTK